MLFRHMSKYETVKNELIYNVMLRVFAQAAKEESVAFEGKDWDRNERIELAHDYIYEMELLGLRPDKYTCNALLAVYCNSQVPERAENCFKSIFQVYDLSPDVHSYLALLRMRRQSGDLANALSVYAQLKLAGDKASLTTTGEGSENKNKNNLKINHLFYSTLLQCCLEQKSFQAGIQVIQDMRDDGLEPYPWILKKFIEKPHVSLSLSLALSLCRSVGLSVFSQYTSKLCLL